MCCSRFTNREGVASTLLEIELSGVLKKVLICTRLAMYEAGRGRVKTRAARSLLKKSILQVAA